MSSHPEDLPRTLLLTHFPPGWRNGSQRQIASLLEHYGDRLCWFSTKPPARTTPPVEAPVPYAHGRLLTRPTRWPLRSLRLYANLAPWAANLGRRAARFGREQGVEVVWSALSVESVVAGRVAAKALGVPLAVTALDDPPSMLAYANYPQWIRWLFGRSFRKTMSFATSHGVISEALAEDYRKAYGVRPFVLYCGVEPDRCLEPPSAGLDRSPRIIGSLGSVISAPLWELLMEAVRRVNESRSGEVVRVLHIGELREELQQPEVEVSGWVSGDALDHQLARVDAFFLPMWFEDSHRQSARTAFPTKIGDFIRAQRPILALGPKDSQIARFVRAETCGEICDQPDAVTLAAALERLLFDSGCYESATEGMRRLPQRFSRRSYFETFEEFIYSALEPTVAGVAAPGDTAR